MDRLMDKAHAGAVLFRGEERVENLIGPSSADLRRYR